MELEHRFELPVNIETAWNALLDIGRIGPCFPGSTLESVDGDEFTGSVKLQLGKIMSLTYSGKARIVEKDAIAHRARIEAAGAAGRSASTAAMIVTATATPVSVSRTAVDLVTTLSLTGRPAQLGRGVMVEFGNKLVSQFADCVSKELTGRAAGGAELIDVVNPDEVAAEVEAENIEAVQEGDLAARGISDPRMSPPRRVAAEPIPVLQTAAVPVLKRVLPFVFGFIGLVLLRKLLRRKPADEQLEQDENAADRTGDEADFPEDAEDRADA